MTPAFDSTAPSKPALPYLAPPACIGVLGGGQLGRMLAQTAQTMGYTVAVLDPDASAPASSLSEHFLCFDYTDDVGLTALSQLASRVTTEFENVPALTLERLARKLGVSPSAACVRIAQDRVLEKTTIQACDLPVAPFWVIETHSDLAQVPPHLFPGILKTTRFGYDGKGQVLVPNAQALPGAFAQLQASPHATPTACVLEKKLPLQAECSVILGRSEDGACVHLPVQINQHHQGVLFSSTVFPGWVDPALEQALQSAAQTLAQALSYVGVLCVEFFILDAVNASAQPVSTPPGAQLAAPLAAAAPTPATGSWVVNEIAPRPHNSGHHSLNSCSLSQFELQLRVLVGLPLTPVAQHSPCVMLNLLGDLWWDPSAVRTHAHNAPQEPDWSRLLALPGTHLHLYGKKEARRGRKMGHLNITADSPEAVMTTVAQCLALLGLESLGLGVSARLGPTRSAWSEPTLVAP